MVGKIEEKPERLWSTDHDHQQKMQKLYKACLEAKNMSSVEAQVHLYAASLMINLTGSVLPSFKAQVVFEIAASE